MAKPIRDMTIEEYVYELKNDKNEQEKTEQEKTEAFKRLKKYVQNGVNDPAEQHEELSNIEVFPLKYYNVSVYLLIDFIFQSKFDEFDNLLGEEGIDSKRSQNDSRSNPVNDSKKFVGRNYSDLKKAIFSENKINKDSTVFQFCTELYKLIRYEKKPYFKEYMKRVFDIDMDAVLMKEQLNTKINAGIKQIILHGAPGTGKTFTAKKFAKDKVNDEKKQIEVVQFHPTYDYTDFVEGLRPVQLTPDGNPTFVRMDGAFKKFCRTAADDTSNKYFFIIDEINRGDVSKILGELMFLMNDPKRTHGEGEIDKIHTPYENLPTYPDENGNMKPYANYDGIFAKEGGFFIPDNVIIIGTMNDIDRSVDAFDFALRRRFAFIKADANAEASASMASILHKDSDEDVIINNVTVCTCIDRLKALNKVIGDEGKKLGLSDDYHIGAAYFAGFDGVFTSLFENSIEPLIREYCRGKNQDSVEKFVQSCRGAFTKENTVK